jgi:chromosomal replication initiation ATPase DnaA
MEYSRAKQVLEAHDNNVESAINQLKDELNEVFFEAKELPSVKKVFITVSKHYNIQPSQVFIKSRRDEIRLPRQIIQWYLVEHLGMTLHLVARITGVFCHSTVMNSQRQINNLIETNARFREKIETIIQDLTDNQLHGS